MSCSVCGRTPEGSDRIKRRRVLEIHFIDDTKVTVCGGSFATVPGEHEYDECLTAAIRKKGSDLWHQGWLVSPQAIVKIVHISLAGFASERRAS